jgi:Sec-independent protein translocase protein TatA
MLVHADEVTLYREGSFLPEPGVADFELLMRRPELFAIAGSRVQGARADVVNRLAKKLGVRPATVPVVRSLFKMVRSLPEFAWRSNAVPQAARDLRSAFDNTKSPERFLFVELPEALKQPGFDEHQTNPRQIEAFFECLNQNLQALNLALPQTLAAARDHLLRACGFAPGAESWQQLRETALRLEPLTTHANLLAFLRRLTQSQNDDTGIASVLALVANCSPASWSDYEVQRLPELAQALGTMFRDARAALDEAAATPFRDLTPPQRRQAEKLQQEMRHFLAAQPNNKDSTIARAALLALAEELNSRNQQH